MKTVVVYRSKSGFTKKYAEWIAAETGADIFEAAKITPEIFASYDTVIYGGGLYIGGINGVGLITKNMEKLKGKKIVVFATGATPGRKEEVDEVGRKNLPAGQQNQIRFFYLRGGFDYRKLKPLDKVLMTLLKWKLKSKKELTPDERGMLAAYERPVDFTRKENIKELVAYVMG